MIETLLSPLQFDFMREARLSIAVLIAVPAAGSATP